MNSLQAGIDAAARADCIIMLDATALTGLPAGVLICSAGATACAILTCSAGATASAILTCSAGATACATLPSPVSARSPRAAVAVALAIAVAWMAVAYLLGPRGSWQVAAVLVLGGLMALAVAATRTDRQSRPWIAALGLALLLVGGADLLLSGHGHVGLGLTGATLIVAAVGFIVLVVGQRLDVPAISMVAVMSWFAWIPGLMHASGDRIPALLSGLAMASLGCLVADVIRPSRTLVVAAAAGGELTWLLFVGTGRAWWPPGAAPIEAYTLGTLAMALLLIGLLARDHHLSQSAARRMAAAIAIAVGVSSMATIAWNLVGWNLVAWNFVGWHLVDVNAIDAPTTDRSRPEFAGLGLTGLTGIAVLAGLLGWLACPAGSYRGVLACDYCGSRDQSGSGAGRDGRWDPHTCQACLGLCRDAGRQRPGTRRILRAVGRRD
jgi:hypothetical protein